MRINKQTNKPETPREAAERIGDQFLDPERKDEWLPLLTELLVSLRTNNNKQIH